LRRSFRFRSWCSLDVREHHAPVGALRHHPSDAGVFLAERQGAPRTCRCIETIVEVTWVFSTVGRQGAPRTCRCIETCPQCLYHLLAKGQGAPRTCRCIETAGVSPCWPPLRRQGAPRTCRCIETVGSRPRAVARVVSGSTTHL